MYFLFATIKLHEQLANFNNHSTNGQNESLKYDYQKNTEFNIFSSYYETTKKIIKHDLMIFSITYC